MATYLTKVNMNGVVASINGCLFDRTSATKASTELTSQWRLWTTII